MRKVIALLILMVMVAAGAAWKWRAWRQDGPPKALTLYGNIDFRQADLAFNNAERIAAMLVEEGDRVTAGQVLARVETERLLAKLAEAQAAVEAQRAVVMRLRNGTRPEEIAQARANVQASEAEQVNAQQEYERLEGIASKLEGRAVSQQDVDNARASMLTSTARLEVSRRALTLAEAGPRQEEIDQAEAQLGSAEARLRLILQQFVDAELRAPVGGVIRARLMEPGEIASPQRAAYSLAVTDPKWVRAYVAETHLGEVRPGSAATVTTDAFPGRSHVGWVGLISPIAEFTPKSVQTDELRTSLVYEVRIFVRDGADELRLGMPATVTLPLIAPPPAGREGGTERSAP